MSTMSTPISNIPIKQNMVSNEEEDPEVLAILKEMQPEESKPSIVIPQNIPSPRNNTQHKQPSNIEQFNNNQSSEAFDFFEHTIAKRAIYSAIIAYVLLHPNAMELLYQKIPMLEKVSSYEYLIRIGLLTVVLYVFMWKFNL